MRTWLKRVGDAAPLTPPAPATGVFLLDAELKSRVRAHIAIKSCPAAIDRVALLDAAVRLRLLHADDAALTPPRKAAGLAKFWGQHVTAALPRALPLSADPARFWTSSQLLSALETHLEQVAPERLSRSALLDQALRLNLVTPEQAALPPPVQLSMEALAKLWSDHADAQVLVGRKRPPFPKGRTRANLTAALLRLGLINEGVAEAKGVRPDVAARKEHGRNCRPATRCASAAALLRGIPNTQVVKDRLLALSEQASRLFFQRSFLVWLHLHRLLRAGLPLPDLQKENLDVFVRRVYTVGTENSCVGKKDPELEATRKMYQHVLPSLARPGSDNLVTHAANLYAGALRRHFCDVETVKMRIKRYVSARLFDVLVHPDDGEEDAVSTEVLHAVRQRRRDVGPTPIHNVLNALEDPSLDVAKLHPEQRQMVAEVRGLLGMSTDKPVELNQRWLRRNIHGAIRFTLKVVDTLDELRCEAEALHKHYEETIADETKRPKIHQGATRGIHFVPLNHLKRRFVTLDATDLVDVLGIKDVPPSMQATAVQEMLQPNITKVFGKSHSPRPAGEADDGQPRWLFTGTIDTDGRSIHPHFLRAKTLEEVTASEAAVQNKTNESKSSDPPRQTAPPRVLLLVDPGRVNLVTITIMLDGKVMTKATLNPKQNRRPVAFSFTNRQYYTLIGDRKRACILRQRQRAGRLRPGDGSIKLQADLSAASLRCGKAESIVAYLRAHIDSPTASQEEWGRALSAGKATDRWRRRFLKDRAMRKWFHQVKRRVEALTGLTEATVVWGCKVAPSGRGNMPVPTDRIAKLAKNVPGWTVVSGDEYRTSAASCVPPHVDNQSPRFRGEAVTRKVRRPQKVRQQARRGFVLGLDAKRLIRRAEHKGKTLKGIGSAPSKGKRGREVSDGHTTATPVSRQR